MFFFVAVVELCPESIQQLCFVEVFVIILHTLDPVNRIKLIWHWFGIIEQEVKLQWPYQRFPKAID
jgi:hypothetical protein